nr:MAG TPA: hypothetical protein [Caudoviricetes sp.]
MQGFRLLLAKQNEPQKSKGREEWMPDTIQWTLNFCAGMCVALLFEVVRIQIKVDDIEKRLIPQDQKGEGDDD